MSSTNNDVQYDDLEDVTAAEFQEIFNLFDFTGTGHISTDDLGVLLRGLQFNVTEMMVCDLINDYDKEGNGRLHMDSVYSMIRDNSPFPPLLEADDVIERFKIFDIHNQGKLHSAKVVQILESMGEGLSHEDVKQLMREVEVDGDSMIDIEAFVRYMHATSMEE
jgi:calmodulin